MQLSKLPRQKNAGADAFHSLMKHMSGLQLRKIANALVVVLPEDVIARLDVSEGALLYSVDVPEGGYRLVPHDPASATTTAEAAEIVGGFRDALTELSK